ncbi:MAG: hypothetical protein HXN39_04350 [Prevotella histicola]|jgi:hypothetical protein|uniref:hypothetical protein n=1 Tax=Prevotella histicola TaxID=470565 RepID=UPI001C5F7202|nr:hypothetical protein [Prevotella histicola]MBF1410849.1 hypothetical protein [Prevotella histicola]MBF1419166.1 hypothetical protein [Prevotella histicola]MBS6662625.1 hypothetical protein [Prevotella histicola]MBW4773186.1 hypothetical protein [Prevotella histicola]
MKRKVFIVFVSLLSLLSCSEKKLPNYPATDEGITRMRLDSASFFTQRHDTRNAMYQLKAAEKHLFNVNTDTLKFTTYYHIALLNAQNGAYKLALNYFNHAAKYANDSKRSHRMADIFLGKASVFNQMGMRDSALQYVKRAESFKPRIRKDQEESIKKIRSRIEKHQVLTVSPEKDIEIIQIQDRYEVAMAQREALQLQLYIAYLLILLILVTGGIIAWFRRRMHQQLQNYRKQQEETELNIQLTLQRKDATIDEMKAEIDSKLNELEQLKKKIPTHNRETETSVSIEQTKLGIDALYTILKGGNISQMGKREQQAVCMIMPNFDYDLAYILNNPRYAFTPKETFYYIMEHNGMTDEEKATAFCCTGQAIRSIKSRMKKKMTTFADT